MPLASVLNSELFSSSALNDDPNPFSLTNTQKGFLMTLRRFTIALTIVALFNLPSRSQDKSRVNDIPSEFKPPTSDFDYVKRVEMIPMRDRVKLYTVIVIPKAPNNPPILLT